MGRRYFRASAPAPWNKSGVATVTVRTGGAFDVYLCIGYERIPLRREQAWALLTALAAAMPAVYGPAPEWTEQPVVEAVA